LFLLVVPLTQTPSAGVQAQSGVSGMWRVESTPGTTWTAVLIAVGSNRVTGLVSSCSSNRGQIEIVDGRRDGNTVSFRCSSINRARTVTFTGQLDGDALRFRWEKAGTGGNPTDDALFGGSAPRTFVARRISSGASDFEVSLAAAASTLRREPAVTFDHILRADQTPENWLTFSGNLQGHRHSPLSQINRANVANLELVWLRQAPTIGQLQATPIVVDGVMYTTRNANDVVALDAATGRELWVHRYAPDDRARASGGGGRPNRGLAILGSTLFLGTLDAHLIALDAYSGDRLWDTTVANARDASCDTGQPCYAITLAPLVVKNLVVVGVAGGEGRTRGFVAAYDARTGKEAWRFHTIPGPGEPNHESWAGESWRTGGAPVWNTGAYDPDLNLTYWGTGNPFPVYDGSTRKGDNLYSNSVVALDADTGRLRWHFQFTPHDVHDWDSAQVPVLVDLIWQGRPRKVMLWANRNGLMYVLDRVTGEFLMGKPFVEVNWTTGFDPQGRPILTSPPPDPVRPGTATNWNPHSYSPRTGLFYVSAWERLGFRPGKAFGAIRAFEPRTGRQVWEFRLDDAFLWRGVLTTGSDLLFTGSWGDSYSDPTDAARVDGYFYALDARTGELLWRRELTSSIQSPPITYAVRGRQYVAVAAGDTMFGFSLRP
jgi:alcohol dehydrogenase (cytochrome c)